MARDSLGVAEVLALLTATPERIAAITAPLTADRLHEPPSPDEWSANEVLAHLRACADVWGECIVAMLEADRPTIRAVNPRTWMERTDYVERRWSPAPANRSSERCSSTRRGSPGTSARTSGSSRRPWPCCSAS